MQRNVEINGLSPDVTQVEEGAAPEKSDRNGPSVAVHQGDASWVHLLLLPPGT